MTPVEAALAVQEPALRDLTAHWAGVELPGRGAPRPSPLLPRRPGARLSAPAPPG
ncbi:hypothetical protein ACRAWD_10255 [Caulobacter segnis]